MTGCEEACQLLAVGVCWRIITNYYFSHHVGSPLNQNQETLESPLEIALDVQAKSIKHDGLNVSHGTTRQAD
jgi:hypothetical protein